jgi:hypothetical protein
MTTAFGGFYDLEADRIRRARVIVNTYETAIQVGASPPRGARAERLVVWLQHLHARRMRRESARASEHALRDRT